MIPAYSSLGKAIPGNSNSLLDPVGPVRTYTRLCKELSDLSVLLLRFPANHITVDGPAIFSIGNVQNFINSLMLACEHVFDWYGDGCTSATIDERTEEIQMACDTYSDLGNQEIRSTGDPNEVMNIVTWRDGILTDILALQLKCLEKKDSPLCEQIFNATKVITEVIIPVLIQSTKDMVNAAAGYTKENFHDLVVIYHDEQIYFTADELNAIENARREKAEREEAENRYKRALATSKDIGKAILRAVPDLDTLKVSSDHNHPIFNNGLDKMLDNPKTVAECEAILALHKFFMFFGKPGFERVEDGVQTVCKEYKSGTLYKIINDDSVKLKPREIMFVVASLEHALAFEYNCSHEAVDGGEDVISRHADEPILVTAIQK